MPVIVLAGEEEFELARAVAELKEKLVDPLWLAFNFCRLDNPDLRAVTEAAATLPFGPGNRLVLIEQCELFTRRKSSRAEPQGLQTGEKVMKALLDDFDRALAAVAPNTYLVFACPHNFDSSLRTAKIVEKYAQVEKERFQKIEYVPGIRREDLARLETWCHKEARRHGATLDEAAITYLLESTQGDLRSMANEIAKAALYVLPERHISLAVVSQLSPHFSHVFSLVDHWAGGRRQKALESLEELLARQSGMPIIVTLQTMLSRWVRLRALAQRQQARLGGPGVQRRELPVEQLARKIAPEIGARSWYAVAMDLKRIKAISTEHLVDKRIELCELEHKVKTGQLQDRQALAIFLSS